MKRSRDACHIDELHHAGSWPWRKKQAIKTIRLPPADQQKQENKLHRCEDLPQVKVPPFSISGFEPAAARWRCHLVGMRARECAQLAQAIGRSAMVMMMMMMITSWPSGPCVSR